MINLGNHETLMNAKNVYYGLVEAQNLRMKGDDQKGLEDDEIPSMIRLLILSSINIKIHFSTPCFRSNEIIK